MPFIRLPRLKVIADREQIESRLVRSDSEFDQLGHCKLFMRQLKADLAREPRRSGRFASVHIALVLRAGAAPAHKAHTESGRDSSLQIHRGKNGCRHFQNAPPTAIR